MKSSFKFERVFTADISGSEDSNILTFSVASSEPALRADKNGKKFLEVLEISDAAIDFSRLVDNRSPLLFEHDRERQLGVVERAWIEDSRLYVTCKFSSNSFPQSILRDIRDGIRRNVSFGYIVQEITLDRETEDGIPIVHVVRYLPYEVSIVSIPQDATVGIDRAFESIDECEVPEEKEDKTKDAEDPATETSEKSNDEKAAPEAAPENSEQKAEEAPETKCAEEDSKETRACEEQEEKRSQEEHEEDSTESTQDIEEAEDAEKKARAAEVQEIRSLSELTNTKELAEKFISENRSLDEFKVEIKSLSTESNVTNKPTNKTMEKKLSLTKLLRGYTSKAPADFIESEEYKMNEEAKRSMGVSDYDIVLTPEMLRAFDGTEALNQIDYRPDLYTNFLRPESVLAKTGARVASVTGPSISFAVATSGLNAGWVGINGEVPSATMDFALKTMTPKKAGAYVDISHQSLIQDDPSATAIVMDDIVKAIDQVLDEGAVKGTGADGQPTGVAATSGINTVAVADVFSLSGVYEMERKIRESNDFGNLKWVMNAKNSYKFKTTPYSAVEQNKMLEEEGKIIGYDVVICNALDDNTIILGNFDELVMANFRGLMLKVVEDAALARKQAVEIVAHADVDFLVRRPRSFTKTTAA